LMSGSIISHFITLAWLEQCSRRRLSDNEANYFPISSGSRGTQQLDPGSIAVQKVGFSDLCSQ
jgi:hypothetical protein